jgi:hypothetical protein
LTQEANSQGQKHFSPSKFVTYYESDFYKPNTILLDIIEAVAHSNVTSLAVWKNKKGAVCKNSAFLYGEYESLDTFFDFNPLSAF